ncbi:hypothetical protein ACRDU6_08340 [Mycolicibacterium sp. ELW1]|uniref:hypothetical protein n=1 Tax=Mycobacteriaceae TaxID=1762 RepID=UPI0011F00C7C|nr:hypothetical protein [Mycobacterium sp. ELW1]QEN12689.1 hypothetical protein D3H54_04890 [Mycobacterium sp. ELW1]
MPNDIPRRGVLGLGVGAALGGAGVIAINSLAPRVEAASGESPGESEPDATKLEKDNRGVIYGRNGFPGPLSVSNDSNWSVTDLPHPLGDFTAGLGSRFVNPDPSDGASGGVFNTGVITQVEGAAGEQPEGKLFLDSLLVRLGLRSYNDSAATAFAGATGVEMNLAVDGDDNSVQHLTGYYVVPILGQVNRGGTSGRIETLQMVRTDSIQGALNATGLHIESLVGIYAGRPLKDTSNPNLTVGSQYSLVSEPGTLIYTDAAEDSAWLGIQDKRNPANTVWLRIAESGNLEFCSKDGTVIAALTAAGELTVTSMVAQNIVATAETWRTVTSPPESGSTYQNTTGAGLEMSANYTPGSGAGNITVDLSADGTGWRTWLTQAFGDGGTAGQAIFRCPANWYYRITLSGEGASLGALNALG